MIAKILSLTSGLVIVISLAAAGGLSFLNLQEETQKEELMLSDFPEVFKNDTIIVIGNNASLIEKESAEAIAVKVENLSVNMSLNMDDTALAEDNKTSYNLILVGTPKSNNLLQEVYNLTNATRVTEEYPGENKGILEILRNPWNIEKSILLVVGSDERGVKAGSEMLTEGVKIKELNGNTIMVALELIKRQETNETSVIANEDDLLGKYEKSNKKFKKFEIGDVIVYWHQRMIDDAIVEFDYIRYELDKNTEELKEKNIHWRDDLPEQLPPIISKEQAVSMIRGEILSTNLYFISPESNVFPIAPTAKNPCWVVRSIDNSIMTITIIDAIEGVILGYGVPPPNRLIETDGGDKND